MCMQQPFIDDYDRFWEMNHKLIMNDGVTAKSLPIRIYLPENCPVIQEPVSPVDDRSKRICYIVWRLLIP